MRIKIAVGSVLLLLCLSGLVYMCMTTPATANMTIVSMIIILCPGLATAGSYMIISARSQKTNRVHML
jgi:hypothetical protein